MGREGNNININPNRKKINMRNKVKTKIVETNGEWKLVRKALRLKKTGWRITEVGWTRITLEK